MEASKSKSSTKAKNKYNAINYDSLRIVVPKGRKSELMAVAEAAGDSLNGYVNKAIEERIIRNKPSFLKAYTIIGGVNGTGKSSFAGILKVTKEFFGEVIDVDKISAQEKVFLNEGEKIALLQIAEFLKEERSFTQETTLSGDKTGIIAATAKELGFFIRLYYIGLDTPEECLRRINNRTTRGGNDIGEVDIRRRFKERWKSIKRILPYCDEAFFFDNDNGFVEVAEYIDGELKLKGDRHPKWVLEFAKYLKRTKL